MSKVIYKYNLDPNAESINIPEGSKVLHIGKQGLDVFVWCEVKVTEVIAPLRKLPVKVVYTGEHFLSDDLNYKTTLFINGLVYHVYMGD